MRFACSIIKTKVHTHIYNVQYLLLFRCGNGYPNAFTMLRSTYIACLVDCVVLLRILGALTSPHFAVICVLLPQLFLRLWLTILSNFQPFQCSHSQFPYAFWLKIAFITMVYLLSQNLATLLFQGFLNLFFYIGHAGLFLLMSSACGCDHSLSVLSYLCIKGLVSGNLYFMQLTPRKTIRLEY